jgi:carbon monoxide dehydrogenase subunit G
MDISGTQRFPGPPQQVWNALHDVAKLQHAIPGAQQVSWLDASTLQVRASVDVGPIKGTGEVRAHVQEELAPGRLVVSIVAEGRRLAAHGLLAMDLAADGPGTVLRYSGKATLGGAATVLDNPLTRPLVDRAVDHFFANLAQSD